MNRNSFLASYLRQLALCLACGSSQPAAATRPAAGGRRPQRQPAQPRRRAGPPAAGQRPTRTRPPSRLGVNEVNLIFTVTDKHGHYIPNLQQSDFALLDDQKAPAKVNSFHQQINLPLRVGIVIDASTSIRSRFQFEQQSATEFLLQMLKARSDRAFVMGFDVTPTVTQDWTNNLDAPGDRRQPAAPRRRHGAVRRRLHRLPRQAARPSRGQEPVRKAMVLHLRRRRQPEPRLPRRGHQGVPARRDHHLRHQHQLDAQPRQGRQGAGPDGRGHRRPGLLPAFGRGDVEQLQRHRRRAAQPVRADLHAGGLQERRLVPHHLSLLQRPALPGAGQEGLLRAARSSTSAALEPVRSRSQGHFDRSEQSCGLHVALRVYAQHS